MELINLSISILFSLLNFVVISIKIFSLKIEKKTFILVAILIYILLLILNAVNNFFLNVPYIYMCSIFICNILLLFICFEGGFIAKMFICFFFVCLGAIYEYFSLIILSYLFDIHLEQINPNSYYYLLGPLITNALLFFTLRILSKIVISLSFINYPKKVLFLLVLPITSFIFIGSLRNFDDLIQYNNFVITIVIVGLLISMILSFYTFFEIVNYIQKENEAKMISSYDKIHKLNFEKIEAISEQNQAVIHDFKKHINIISRFVELNQFDLVSNYIDEINEDLSISLIINTEQKIFDLVVNQYINEFANQDILFKYDVSSCDLSFIKPYEQNIIFSNLLENAIESCKRVKENRSINFKMKMFNNKLIIKQVNSCVSVNFGLDGLPITIKENKQIHGYGLKNVISILKKFNGTYKFEFDNQNMKFQTVLIIDVPKEDCNVN